MNNGFVITFIFYFDKTCFFIYLNHARIWWAHVEAMYVIFRKSQCTAESCKYFESFVLIKSFNITNLSLLFF